MTAPRRPPLRRWPCRLGLALALAGLPPAVAAQHSPSIRFERLTQEQGLSQGTVNCLLQDRIGFLWLGTQDGLDRYDGYRFTVYKHDPQDPTSLPSSWISALALDPSGDFWIGTEGGGLARWHQASDSFTSYRHDPRDPSSLSSDRVRAVYVDRQGVLWAGTFDAGLNRLDPERGSFVRFRHRPDDKASLSDDRVRAIYEDRLGQLWVGTLGGLNRFDRGSGTFARYRHDPADVTSLSSDAVLALLEDHAGTLWVGTEKGLNRRLPGGAGFARYRHDPAQPASLSHDLVRVLFEDGERRLWIGTDRGLNLLEDAAAGIFAAYRQSPADPSSLSADRVAAIYQDRGGVMWIGTQGGGASKWNPRSWAFGHQRADPSRAESLSSNAVSAFAEDGEGRLWIGTLGGGLDLLDRSSGRVTVYRHRPGDPQSLSDDRVSSLLRDRQGSLWIGTFEGLDRLDPGARAFRHYRHDPRRPSSLSSNVVASLFEDRQGNLWVGTYGAGFNLLLRGSDAFRRFRHRPDDPTSLRNDQVLAFAEDDEALWIGTFEGLDRFDPESGTFQHLGELDAVFVLHRDDAGTLWIGTRSGLYRLTGIEASGAATFDRFGERDGLPNEVIWGIQPDDRGRLWLSTNKGLCRFEKQHGELRCFDVSHGLQSNEFNYGAHFRSRSGELFFGGVNGFNAFFPDAVGAHSAPPPVVVTSFTKLNNEVDFGRPLFAVDAITLDHRDYFFSFELAALDYAAPHKNRYRYMLEGLDHDWVDVGERRLLTFTNLDPGTYVLRAQGANSDGAWNEAGVAVRITITPPFWLTWWFKAAVLLSGLAGAALVHSLRTRSIRRNNERLKRLVEERTRELEEAQRQLLRRERLAVLGELAGSVAHEIRNPLGVMKNAIYYLRLTRTPLDPRTDKHLALIEKEIERSNEIITELLDYAREPSSRIAPFALQDAFERAAAAERTPPEVRVVRDYDPQPLIVAGDRGQIERLLANLIRNACQAMPQGGELRLACHRRGAEAVAVVADDGVGIAAEDLERIFEPLYSGKATGIGLGLALSRRYAEANGGRIECESALGEGATFRLILPLADRAPAAAPA